MVPPIPFGLKHKQPRSLRRTIQVLVSQGLSLLQGQLAILSLAGRKCEPEHLKTMTAGMAYSGHRLTNSFWLSSFWRALNSSTGEVIQWAGIAAFLLLIILSYLPTRKGIFSFLETSGLFLDEEGPPNRLHFSQQHHLNTLLLVVKCLRGLILNIRYSLPLGHQVSQTYSETLTSLPGNVLSLL